jgi:hypothetical protein
MIAPNGTRVSYRAARQGARSVVRNPQRPLLVTAPELSDRTSELLLGEKDADLTASCRSFVSIERTSYKVSTVASRTYRHRACLPHGGSSAIPARVNGSRRLTRR